MAYQQVINEPAVGVVREFTIGASDINARAQALALCGAAYGPIRSVRVLAGTGILGYVSEDGKAQKAGDVTALQPGDVIDPVYIQSINGTGNATQASAALTLRVRW